METLIFDGKLSDKLLSEWHPTKNEGIDRNEITYGSYEFIWWICSEGHEWGATIYERMKKRECPKCLRKKKTEERMAEKEEKQPKTLIEADPELAKQWDFEKNDFIAPDDVSLDERKYRWWKCSRGHSWEDSINSRYQEKSTCPYCADKKVCHDNCLATVYPELAKEWFVFENMEYSRIKTPYSVLYKSHEEAYWVCDEGHVWWEKISQRVKNGKGCRECEKYKKSIAFLNPELAKEWHPSKNKEVYGVTTPEETSVRCNERAWWLCSKCGNEYKAMVKARHEGEVKCPSCYPPEPKARKRKGKYQIYTDMEDKRVIFENNLRDKLKEQKED
ncbi:zinc-ribbon domain-containing protein [Bacillus manliponensis]|uniref:zinc-ribbon domain-containing protein n=1 Tax=Bacillus manliponensis TaxID=574376 RepID=UPI0035151A4D